MRAVLLCAILAILPRIGTANDTANDTSDATAMQGTWRVSAAELGGKPLPAEARTAFKLTLKGET